MKPAIIAIGVLIGSSFACDVALDEVEHERSENNDNNEDDNNIEALDYQSIFAEEPCDGGRQFTGFQGPGPAEELGAPCGGICTPHCEDDTDCPPPPEGGVVDSICEFGVCLIPCEVEDEACPSDMECIVYSGSDSAQCMWTSNDDAECIEALGNP